MDRVEQAKKIDLREIIQLESETHYGHYKSGFCPFHEAKGSAVHKQPSFLVYADGYHCLSSNCGKSGNIFNWYAHLLYNDDKTSLKNGKFVEILDRILNEPVRSQPLKGQVVKLVKTSPDEDVNLYRLAKSYYRNLVKTPERLTYFLYRGFKTKTIKEQMWGWDGKHYALTVWEGAPRDSGLLSIRLRIKDKGEGSRYSGVKGNNQKMLYNKYVLDKAIEDQADFVLVTYGEFDAALAWQDGIYAVSPTNGAKSLNADWFKDYKGNVVIMPDRGEETDGYADAANFGVKGWVYRIPKGDFKDYTGFRQQGGEPSQISDEINNLIHDEY